MASSTHEARRGKWGARAADRARKPTLRASRPAGRFRPRPAGCRRCRRAYDDARDDRQRGEIRHPGRGRSGPDACTAAGRCHTSAARHAPVWPCRARARRSPTRCDTRLRRKPCTDRWDAAACRRRRTAGIRSDGCVRARPGHSRSPVAFRRRACAPGRDSRGTARACHARCIRAAARSRTAGRRRCRASWHRRRPSRDRGSVAPWHFRPVARQSGSSCPGTGAAPRAAAAPNRSPRAVYPA